MLPAGQGADALPPRGKRRVVGDVDALPVVGSVGRERAIEGGEWPVLLNLSRALLRRFRIQPALSDINQLFAFTAIAVAAAAPSAVIFPLVVISAFDRAIQEAVLQGFHYWMSAFFSLMIFTPMIAAVPQLRELDLDLRLGRAGPAFENLQYEPLPVDYFDLAQACKVVHLGRLEHLVEHDYLGLYLLHHLLHFLGLAPADAETEALRRRIDLQVARMELAVLGQSLGLEQATRFVDLLELSGISASEREEVIEHGEREVERTNLTGIEVEFQVPIFDFGETRVRRARETYLQSVHRLAEMGVNVRSEAREAYKTLRATYDIARLYRDEVVPLSNIVTEEMTLRYTAMIEDVTDLLVITRSAIQANVAANEALRDYWIASVDLQMALAAGGPSGAPGAPGVAAAPAEAGGQPH